MQRQTGLTLVELLVAMGLGVFLLSAVVQVMLGSRQSFDVIRAQSSMQEAGRFSADFLAKSLRHAGYVNGGVIDAEFAGDIVNINDSSYALQWPAQNGFEEEAVVTGADGGAAEDTITIRLQGDPDTVMVDCEGRALTADDTLIVRMTFAVNTATDELTCQVFDGSSDRAVVALVSGIEDMQVMYGLATAPTEPHLVGRYVNAGDIGAGEWKDVVAIRIGLMAVSGNTPLEQTARSGFSYQLLDKNVGDIADGKSRQVFTQTIALRNKLSG